MTKPVAFIIIGTVNFKKVGEKMSRVRPASKAAEMTKIALLVAMNCVSAYIIIPLPFALSPIAMQPFIVNLVGFLMTPKQAFMTMLVYILVGLAGIPVFTGGTAGPGKLFGPTGGYIFGFLVAATAIAYLKGRNYNFLRYSIVGVCVWIPVIYALGAGQMMLLTGMSLEEAFFVGVLPFAPLDIIKVVGAAWLAGSIHRIFAR